MVWEDGYAFMIYLLKGHFLKVQHNNQLNAIFEQTFLILLIIKSDIIWSFDKISSASIVTKIANNERFFLEDCLNSKKPTILICWLFEVGRFEEALFAFSRLDSKGVKECKSDRSRQELSNEYLVTKFGLATAENEFLKVCQDWGQS